MLIENLAGEEFENATGSCFVGMRPLEDTTDLTSWTRKSEIHN